MQAFRKLWKYYIVFHGTLAECMNFLECWKQSLDKEGLIAYKWLY